MRKTFKVLITLLALSLILSFAGCGNENGSYEGAIPNPVVTPPSTGGGTGATSLAELNGYRETPLLFFKDNSDNIVVNIRAVNGATADTKVGFVKFKTDGSYDDSFGFKEFNTTESLQTAVVDSNGNYYFLNANDMMNNSMSRNVLKFDSDLNYVTSFGNQGDIPLQPYYSIVKILVDDTDNLYIVTTNNSPINTVIYKFDSAGSPVAAFGTNGVLTINPSGNVRATTAEIVNGLLYVIGDEDGAGAISSGISYNLTTGAVDSTFSFTLDYPLSGYDTIVKFVSKDSNNNLYMLPATTNNLDSYAKFSNTGTQDNSFSTGGFLQKTISGSRVTTHPIKVDSNDRLYLIENVPGPTISVFLTRYDNTGALDTTFNNGSATYDISDKFRFYTSGSEGVIIIGTKLYIPYMAPLGECDATIGCKLKLHTIDLGE